MKFKIFFLMFAILALCFTAFGQQKAKRTITNADLEKFKVKRIAAERDLRENYEKLGFPSPEEMERRRKTADEELEKLSEKLLRERLERERVMFEQQFLQSQSNPDVFFINNNSNDTYRPLIYSGSFYRYPRYYRYKNYGNVTLGGGYFYPNANPNQGVRINTDPIRINTTGPVRPPVRIRAPRN
ncbi:MAG: hypothetical protein KIS76_12270 [Pyrinomonadaceae bacterium]|nr:hypothetical protein [Pyrinomonadaceae bacterium]